LELILAVLAGLLTGVLSGYGVGGGTLLMLYLVSVAGMEQAAAQGINLLYFIPCSATALVSHIKNGLVEKSVVIPAAIAGVITTPIAAFLATSIESDLLKKCFGVFLLAVGIRELFYHPEKKKSC
jgi:Predicted permeases